MEKVEFKQIFDKYYKSIKNFLYFKSGNINLSEDIAQEVFITVWEKRDGIIPEKIKPLLYTIATNLFLNHYKHQKIEYQFCNESVGQAFAESPEYIMELKEFDAIVQKAIAGLSEKQREVFLMNRIESLSYAEIAQRLCVSESAVDQRMKLALVNLKNIFGKQFKF